MSDVALPCPCCHSSLPANLVWSGGPILCPQCHTLLALKDANPTGLTWYFAGRNQEQVGPFSWVQLGAIGGGKGCWNPATSSGEAACRTGWRPAH